MRRLDFTHAGRAGTVRVEVGANDDPAALGCGEGSRGLAYCRATVETTAGGYDAALGWIQLVDSTDEEGGFAIDPFEALGESAHPFCFFGFAPTLFDGPSRPTRADLRWRAHAFLAAIVEERTAAALVGFEWGFEIRAGEVTIAGPSALPAAAWPAAIPILERSHPEWRFATGEAEQDRAGA
jgi:hypothetical protein